MKQQSHNQSSHDRRLRRIEMRSAVPIVILFSISLLSVSRDKGDVVMSAGVVISIAATFLAIAVLVGSMLFSYRQADELQQRVQLKAAASTFVVVMVGMFAASMLQAYDVVEPVVSLQVLFIGGGLLWVSLLAYLKRQATYE